MNTKCTHAASGCDYPVGECSGACLAKPVLSAFAKEARRAYSSSKVGTSNAERATFSQSPDLQPFTLAERAGAAGSQK